MGCISGEGRRIILWMCWVTNMLITSIYYILSFATCANLVKSYKLLDIEISNEIWRAPVAASLLGGLLVLLFNVLSCAILIKKSIHKGGPGFGYGFVCAFCFTLAFFCLLCGLVLDGFKDTVKGQLEVKLAEVWSKVHTGTYLGTIGFAYLCFVMFLLFFFALVIFQGAVTEELGLPPVRPVNPYARMADPYAMGMQDPMLMAQAGMMGPAAPGMMMMMPAGMMVQQQAAAAGIKAGMRIPGAQPLPTASPDVPSPAHLAADPSGAL